MNYYQEHKADFLEGLPEAALGGYGESGTAHEEPQRYARR